MGVLSRHVLQCTNADCGPEGLRPVTRITCISLVSADPGSRHVPLAGAGHTPALDQSATPPPSTTRAAPVMNDESSEARKRTDFAISSGVPIRPMGRSAQLAR